MKEQYFGTRQLYELCLKANTPISFGSREIEVGEPILWFERALISQAGQSAKPIMARGGRGNAPQVIWEDRGEMNFIVSEGTMSPLGMGLILGSNVIEQPEATIIPKREGPFTLNDDNTFFLKYSPLQSKKVFVFEYENDCIQRKIDYELNGNELYIESGNPNSQYVIDYYFNYFESTISYLIGKERFKETFMVEGKFYSKDENEGMEVTNVLTIPKVRIISDINLRLGEKADPVVSVFDMIAMPVRENGESLVMKITRLEEDIDADI